MNILLATGAALTASVVLLSGNAWAESTTKMTVKFKNDVDVTVYVGTDLNSDFNPVDPKAELDVSWSVKNDNVDCSSSYDMPVTVANKADPDTNDATFADFIGQAFYTYENKDSCHLEHDKNNMIDTNYKLTDDNVSHEPQERKLTIKKK